MQEHNIDKWLHDHNFYIESKSSEKRSLSVIILTIIMMFAEIFAGYIFGSMALLADGWHMGTHAAAIGITYFAYRYARKHAKNRSYSFGTGKVNILGGYTSAILLGLTALAMFGESIKRLINPEKIFFNEAIIVAIIGLIVNLVSAVLLHEKHSHHHDHSKNHNHNHEHHDHNIRAAYLHVLADAMTSVLAIIALLLGKYFNWLFLDPAIGVIGAIIIFKWAIGLSKDTSSILLDSGIKQDFINDITNIIENDSDNKVTDLHIWRINSNQMVLIMSLVTDNPKESLYYKKLLSKFHNILHMTIEVTCPNKIINN